MASASHKPVWLESFHAYLRARPIKRAVFFALGCFVLFAIYLWIIGRPLTVRNLAIELAAWSVGGVLFYVLMRWVEAKDAR